ncbi:MAG: alpha/beta hydrolase [Candidatus Omnitrophica bacterium]|nr:alpha/beta hydrolase [Candidatus Omnitrophota bacterium]
MISRKRFFRKTGFFVTIAVILLILAIAYQQLGEISDLRQRPSTGKMVDVGGYELFSSVIGEGTPTVVFESGLARASYDWAFVAPKVSEFATAVTYDRAGLGWSDLADNPRDGEQIAKDLHTLLERLEVEPPFLLVGHSCGGLYVRIFHHLYPDQVCGMVLIDSAHEEGWDEAGWDEETNIWEPMRIEGWSDATKAFLGLYRLRSAFGSELAPQEENTLLPSWAREQYQISYRRPAYHLTYAREHLGLHETLKQLQSIDPSLDDLPLTVITGTNPMLEQEHLADLSTNSIHIVHEDRSSFEASHFLQWTIPDVIAEEIEKRASQVINNRLKKAIEDVVQE